METVYSVQNNMKLGKAAKYYVIGTQGILTMAIMCALGFYIGYRIDKDSIWPGLLAFIGMMAGLVSFITSLLYLLKRDGKKSESKE